MTNQTKFSLKNKLKEFKGVECGWKYFTFIWCQKVIDGKEECNGLTDFHTGFIFLDETMNEDLLHEIILHELTHIILEVGGIEDGIKVNNEDVVYKVSRGYRLLARLNPELMGVLFDGRYFRHSGDDIPDPPHFDTVSVV